MDNYFIHEETIIESGARIGNGTRIWAFVHILHCPEIHPY